MADGPEFPERASVRRPRPEPRLKTADEMSKAIRRIMKRQQTRATESQYDVLVCIRSVAAARAVFEGIPVKGSAMGYGTAVEAALGALSETYWDSDGEYTSRGQVGDVWSDVHQLLKRQWSLEHSDIDKKEARHVIITEMAELSRSISEPPGENGEVNIKFEAHGAGGTPYFLAITFQATSPREYDMLGKIYADEGCQILIQEERLPLAFDDDN